MRNVSDDGVLLQGLPQRLITEFTVRILRWFKRLHFRVHVPHSRRVTLNIRQTRRMSRKMTRYRGRY